MRLGPLTLERRALRSRIARRIFSVFVACSLAPVGIFALFAWMQVRSQLEDDAAANLRRASKGAGMAIMERLMIAEHGLEVLTQRFRAKSPLESRLRVGDGRILEVAELSRRQLDELTAAQHAELSRGGTLLLTKHRGAPPARVQLVRRLDRADADSPVIAADLDTTFVFEPRSRGGSDHYWVEDERGRQVFDARPTFDMDGETTVSARWDLFLRSRFLSPSWTIAFSRPMAEIHRPLHRFESLFPLIALAAFGVAVWFSLVQIRRSMVPIEALADAARRISRGDLEARVAIETRDEFGELGDTFNEMASEIGRQIQGTCGSIAPSTSPPSATGGTPGRRRMAP